MPGISVRRHDGTVQDVQYNAVTAIQKGNKRSIFIPQGQGANQQVESPSGFGLLEEMGSSAGGAKGLWKVINIVPNSLQFENARYFVGDILHLPLGPLLELGKICGAFSNGVDILEIFKNIPKMTKATKEVIASPLDKEAYLKTGAAFTDLRGSVVPLLTVFVPVIQTLLKVLASKLKYELASNAVATAVKVWNFRIMLLGMPIKSFLDFQKAHKIQSALSQAEAGTALTLGQRTITWLNAPEAAVDVEVTVVLDDAQKMALQAQRVQHLFKGFQWASLAALGAVGLGAAPVVATALGAAAYAHAATSVGFFAFSTLAALNANGASYWQVKYVVPYSKAIAGVRFDVIKDYFAKPVIAEVQAAGCNQMEVLV